MAREFAKDFYDSKEWRGTKKNNYKDGVRQIVIDEANGICQQCGEPGEEVHHKIWLTHENINDVNITLGLDNLILLCKDCHRNIHRPKVTTREGLRFDENGDLIQT